MHSHNAITNHFSDPGRAIGQMCVCVCVRTITFEQNDLWSRYFARWFTTTLPTAVGQIQRLRSRVKVVNHRRKCWQTGRCNLYWELSSGLTALDVSGRSTEKTGITIMTNDGQTNKLTDTRRYTSRHLAGPNLTTWTSGASDPYHIVSRPIVRLRLIKWPSCAKMFCRIFPQTPREDSFCVWLITVVTMLQLNLITGMICRLVLTQFTR